MSKHELLQAHFRQYAGLFKERETVPGYGNADSALLLVGEAPGRDEVRLKKPFVGAAGRQLDEFMEYLGLERESIYITNTIKYRLSRTDPKSRRVSNRPATRKEIDQNRQHLLREIDIIRPEYIVTLGNVPLRAVIGRHDVNIGSMHGEVKEIEILQRNYRLFALYHPASIIYNRSLKDTYINDVKELGRLLKTRREYPQSNI